jgi:DtxR family Mn-dependent transcriptional regulator
MIDDTVTTSGQDYLEAIMLISERNGAVRSVDIANHMQVSRAGVSKALGALREKGLIRQERYGSVYLTDEGIKVANSVILRHKALKAFLIDILGVCPETAEQDACRLEHAISPDTLKRLEEFMKNAIKHY